MDHSITIDTDQADLLLWALQDYLARPGGDQEAARFKRDYGVGVPAMDVGTLVAACADALYTLCKTPVPREPGIEGLAALDLAEAEALGPDGWWFR